jgi:hypothetical protein
MYLSVWFIQLWGANGKLMHPDSGSEYSACNPPRVAVSAKQTVPGFGYEQVGLGCGCGGGFGRLEAEAGAATAAVANAAVANATTVLDISFSVTKSSSNPAVNGRQRPAGRKP